MKKMEEDKYWENTARFLSGEMSSEEAIQFKKNMDASNEAEVSLNEMEKHWNTIEETTIMNQFDENKAWEKLYGRFEEEKLIPDSKKRIIPKYWVGIAASLVLLLSVATAFFLKPDDQLRANMQTLETASRENLALNDGSTINVNSNSVFTYPDQFLDKQRRVSLEGEAFFDIERNPEKPFIINAGDAEIKVLGTSFNVVHNTKLKRVEVYVNSGKVSLYGKSDTTKSLILTPGEIGYFQNGKLLKKQNEDLNIISWKTHQLRFSAENSFDYIIRTLEKTYEVKFNLHFTPDESLSLTSMKTWNYDSVDSVLEILCTSMNLRYARTGSKIDLYQTKRR